MKLKEMKIKVFSLIEEYYPELSGLAEDEDVLNKINGVINSIQVDLMKYRKIPANQTITIDDENENVITLSEAITDIYQTNKIILKPTLETMNKDYEFIDDDTVQIDPDFRGDVVVYYYKLPAICKLEFDSDAERDAYDEEFEFDIDLPLLEVMPYGVARDLLRLDMISVYGTYFERTYNELKAQLDSRRTKGMISFVGGIDI
jgi:hypothetical protein